MKAPHYFALVLASCSLTSAAVTPPAVGWNQDNSVYKPANQHEGKIEAFLGEQKFSLQSLFAG
ncbi:MAG: hypothetical protein ACO3RV_02085, partial [Luteolibacter sp.]